MIKLRVLDHGFVRLVSYMGNDLAVVRSARVSHNAEWRVGKNRDKDEKLIHYLMRNHHTSPFESVSFTFEVKAPIFIFRQWHRHRTWSYNEVSARYSELPEEFYIPAESSIGAQDSKNKQGRTVGGDPRDANLFRDALQDHSKTGFRLYKTALESGIPREIARCFLSVNTYSKMFASVNLHNLFHFLSLRLHPHAQYEMQMYAGALLELIRPVVPVSVDAWKGSRAHTA